MIFSKAVLLALIVVLLNACSGASIKPEQDQPVEVDPESSAVAVEQPFVAIAKPTSVAVTVPQSARGEFALAKQLLIKKDWNAAISELLVMTETYPELAGVYVNLGIAYTKVEKFEDAENAYRFAIEKNPLNFDAYTNLGVLLRSQGKFTEAESVYLDALKRWPHHQASLINLGVLYDMYMGKLPEALANYELAQKLNEEEDRKLKGWIIDLQRRIPK